jgi:hypothetical protein
LNSALVEERGKSEGGGEAVVHDATMGEDEGARRRRRWEVGGEADERAPPVGEREKGRGRGGAGRQGKMGLTSF